MKKSKSVSVFALVVVLLIFGAACLTPITTARANMAQPMEDRGSGILFDKHESVKVDSEVLNIKINKSEAPKSAGYRRAIADMSAVYTMTNISAQQIDVNAMFLSPVYSQTETDYVITSDGKELEYTTEFFSSSHPFLKEDDITNWEEILAAANPAENNGFMYVSAVSYSFGFEPGQTIELAVSYKYNININNRHPNHTVLRYFLTPAKYWQDFGSLTINLTLDKEQPVLVSSSLDFYKLSKGVYKHKSNGVPQSELTITAGASPLVYILPWMLVIAVVTLPIAVVILLIFGGFFAWRVLKKRKSHKI